MRDLESIKQESMILRDKMQSVKTDICKVNIVYQYVYIII